MAITYFMEDELSTPAPHHAGIKALWETKWKKPCQLGIYPFEGGKYEDFEKVFTVLAGLDLKEPYDPDVYTGSFMPVADNLVAQAEAAEAKGDKTTAKELFLRASAVYRVSRFPINYATGKNAEAFRRGSKAFFRAGRYMTPRRDEVLIPHVHGIGEEVNSKIPVCYAISESATVSAPAPVILFQTGLDGYRVDQDSEVAKHLAHGFAVIVVEIPGTGDCPAIRYDPLGADRLWDSILDWINAQPELDSSKIVARSVSTGGYYAARIVHTHKDRILAGVCHGGGLHHMFDPKWIKAQNNMEYPFSLAEALAYKFGYATVEEYQRDAQKTFSLLDSGLIDGPSAPLLVVNGVKDTIFPIEDSLLLLGHGNVKSARFSPTSGHMGMPEVHKYVYSWIDSVVKA